MEHVYEKKTKENRTLALSYLKRLLEENEFEMWRTEDMEEGNWKVTYMFNDAVESYLLLEQVAQTGEYDRESDSGDMTEEQEEISGGGEETTSDTDETETTDT